MLAIAALSLGGTASATPRKPAKPTARHLVHHASKGKSHALRTPTTAATMATRTSSEPSESAGETETSDTPASDGDAAAQAAACQAAGIDPNADNVNYDDATGTCSLDTGGGDSQSQG